MFDLSRLGWDEGFRSSYAAYASMYARLDRASHRPARVSGVDRGIRTVLGATGPYRTSVGGGLLAAAALHPVCLPGPGDWVVVRTWPDQRTTIEAVLPRRTAIIREPDADEALPTVLAANVDAAAVVVAAQPRPDPRRISALLALARESGARPLVIVTATGRAAGPDQRRGERRGERRLDPAAGLVAAVGAVAEALALAASSVEVYGVHATCGVGLAPLRPYVAHGRTLGLLCLPGSGASTLVNALAGATVMTTTGRRALVALPGGGVILDAPGLRSGWPLIRMAL